MKKWTAALVTLAVGVSALALPASAAEATFVDTLEDNYPLVYEISEWIPFRLFCQVSAGFGHLQYTLSPFMGQCPSFTMQLSKFCFSV